MNRKILSIIGVPGSGKSTLVKRFIKSLSWVEAEPVKLLRCMYNEANNLYLLGVYAEGETFPGTDRLSMAVQPAAQEFITSSNANFIFEGDRLGNKSFLDFIIGLPNTDFNILSLVVDDTLLQDRYKERGSNQTEKFLKSRHTKIANLNKNLDYLDYLYMSQNNDFGDQCKNLLTMFELMDINWEIE